MKTKSSLDARCYEQLSRLIKNDSKVADIACGDDLLLRFLQKNKNLSIFSISEKSALDKLLESGDEIFDYVILYHKIPDLKNYQKIIKEALRVSKRVIIAFVNDKKYSILDFENLSSSLDFIIEEKKFLFFKKVLPKFLSHKIVANIFASEAFFLIRKNQSAPTLQEEFIFEKPLNSKLKLSYCNVMKKVFLSVFAIIFTASCSEEYHLRKPRFTPKNPKHERIKSGYSYRMRPSDSMQIGTDKENKVHTQVGYYKQKEQDDVKLVEVLDEDNDHVGYYKIGNPYEIEGVSYVPQNYEDFEETGTASWYGDIFHGRLTANGETYNMESLTAAHPTLPLPSLVKVTNLRNGKTAVVRVNDRGPFAKNRIIDVSERAAEILGFKQDGTTEVKIELLSDETEKLLKRLRNKPSDY